MVKGNGGYRLPPLYPIVDAAVCEARGVAPLDLAAACLRGGAALLQVRSKTGGSGAFLELVRQVRTRADGAGARVVVNDRADIAALAGSAGVHVGQDDLPVKALRRMLGAQAIVGLSTHTREQVDAAVHEPVDYIAVGPIFDTGTKDTGYTARGLELVGYAAATGFPVVAIGGISLENARSVIGAGATTVAVIGDLFAGGNPEARVRALLEALS